MTLSNSFDISTQGLQATSDRLQLHTNNIANADTPYYVRRIPVLAQNSTQSFESILGQLRNGVLQGGISASPGGVEMIGYALDGTPAKKVYQPGNPQADKDGYITLSNVNVLSDMADATMCARLYEANIAVFGVVRSMATRALDIGR